MQVSELAGHDVLKVKKILTECNTREVYNYIRFLNSRQIIS
ncbi:MAG: hypothetical protein SGJ04_10495 [Bacteroidota bacterium]|nr:hypothetical protein [Bacteroidota bacterium]